MSFRFTVVETNLNRAEFRWKWLKFLRHSFVLGIILCGLLLGFGAAMTSGAVTSQSLALVFLVGLGAIGFIVWAALLIGIVAGNPDRGWLGAALERVDRRLLDRVNTLLSLERGPVSARSEGFAVRIARQTQGILAERTPPPAFAATGVWRWFLGFLLAVLVTGLFFQLNRPWQHLLAAQNLKTQRAAAPEKPLELAEPITNNVEQNQNWGEVRITDPGTDLKVTKVDVVPLQIEAAANSPLQSVQWASAINGAGETKHQLPAPSEPRYGVFQPTVYLDELQLSDWDVMTYYAKASAEKQKSFASDVYFLEVRPFREDLLKMPGGENGKAYQTLSELSALIARQQHVIRQTHQHVQNPPEQENLQAQDRKKLSEAETDLDESTQHLYAKMAAGMENRPIGEALDNLAKAEKSLADASRQLEGNTLPEAQNSERGALSELVAARKMFQKALSDNPRDFDEPKDEETPPVAEAAKKLNQMAEFRNEAKAAQDFVQKTLEQQRSLEQRARSASRGTTSRLGEQEKQLQQSLNDFQGQHPEVFKGAESESQQAQEAMGHAAEALQQGTTEAFRATRRATQQLEKFSEAMQDRSAGKQLANAYRLRQMLEEQIQTFDQRTKPDSKVSDAELQQTAEAARETVNQLKKSAEQEPTRDAFGPPLRDALSGHNKVDLDAKLTQLEQAQDEAGKEQKAAEVRDSLAKVGQAFDESQPKSLQMARKSDALKPGEQEGFGTGLAELESLVRQMEENRRLSREAQGKQGQQALYDLQTGMRSQYGSNERGNQILLHLKEALKTDALDPGDLRKLMEQLQHFAVETSDQLAKKEDKPEVSNIDPTRLPPAYRGRIQRYFQKLSEK